ncbi:unnamed protein product [Peronospora belbahrii]|uniref:Uncharacterized protein n=1 Tax=Peronospora belbahrii TaxID=622444 RepID=A0AAU9LFC3_9STRA|nr:unnamed protein product [Peronospora belbahrii]
MSSNPPSRKGPGSSQAPIDTPLQVPGPRKSTVVPSEVVGGEGLPDVDCPQSASSSSAVVDPVGTVAYVSPVVPSSALPATMGGSSQASGARDLQDRLDAYSRRLEACEGRPTTVLTPDAYWITLCELLERELQDTRRLVVQLREDHQQERSLAEHLRWRMDYHQSRYALMMAELDHEDFFTSPLQDLAAPPVTAPAVPPTAVTGKRHFPAKATAKVPKAAKSSTPSTPASSAPKSPPQALPLVPCPDPDDDTASDDSEVVRTTLARTRSSRRRTTPTDPPLPAVSADSVSRLVTHPSPELFRAIFGSSDSEV